MTPDEMSTADVRRAVVQHAARVGFPPLPAAEVEARFDRWLATITRPEPREMSWGVRCVMAKAARAPGKRQDRRVHRERWPGPRQIGGPAAGVKQGLAIATYYCALGPFLRNGRDDCPKRRHCRLAFL